MNRIIRNITVSLTATLLFSACSDSDAADTPVSPPATATDILMQSEPPAGKRLGLTTLQPPAEFTRDELQSAITAATYVINRSSASNAYSVWHFDLNSPTLFNQVATNPEAMFPSSYHLSATGGYLISYSPPQMIGDEPPNISYRLFDFDPANPDPLNGKALQHGMWHQTKFSGYYDHYTWRPETLPDILQLVPMTGYMLAYMPASTRGTYRLWNFDPAPNAPGTADPLPNAITPQSAFSLIGEGSQLLPIGNYVLEWISATSNYRVWSFDPQEMTPLQLPVISEGSWPFIDTTHELLVIGEYLLDWVPSTRAYKLWHFDPHQTNPLVGPWKSGMLPEGFDASSILTSIQNTVPIDNVAAEIPGTMDFMRDKIEHVVVYMLESRTMDSVLGWLYANNPPELNFINAEPPFRGTSSSYSNQGNGQTFNVYQFENGALSTNYDLTAPVIDPFHDTPDAIHQQYGAGYEGYFSGANPDMSGFVRNNASREVMVTLTPEQLPVLNGLAASFAVSDEWFSALPGGTDSNRAMALTGSTFNITTTYEGNPQYEYFPDTAHRQSIWKVLWNNGIMDWKIYWSVKWYDYVFTYHLYLAGDIPAVDNNVAAGGTDYVAPISQFLTDASSGTLPRFSFLEPAWIAPTGSTSYHPGGDLVPPEKELNKIYQAIANGPGWDKTALVITFSKGGGLYDHVPPPNTINPWPKDSNDGFTNNVLGPRVPTIVVSPWVNANTVFRSPGIAPLSATSMPATVLEWFGIPKARWGLGDRVQVAETFEEVFQRTTARTDKPAFPNPYDKSYPPSYSYTLSVEDAEALYPNASWLPPAYAPCFTSLTDTVQTFTLASAINSHISNPTVKVIPAPTGKLLIELGSTDATQAQLATFADRHRAFMPVAKEALAGVNYCKQQSDCWRSATDVPGNGKCQTKPDVWALFVAWAVALDGYASINLMDYPPNSNMQNASSTDNVTMNRWRHVLATVGVPQAEISDYEVIVNTRPIAAPGAGDHTKLPQSVDANDVFAGPGRDWIGKGLDFFTNPPSNQANNALPILILGSPARKTWSKLIGYSGDEVEAACMYSAADEVRVLGYGLTQLPGTGKQRWWVASNHPDTTMYNCCPNDPTKECQGPENTNLVACDKVDLTAACMQFAFGRNPGASTKKGDEIFAGCSKKWNSANPTADVATAICIDARMSYNFNSQGRCDCEKAAVAFCAANNSNACNEVIPNQAQMCTVYNRLFCGN